MGSKGRYDMFAGKTVLPYLSALKMYLVFKGTLQMSRFILLLLYLHCGPVCFYLHASRSSVKCNDQ